MIGQGLRKRGIYTISYKYFYLSGHSSKLFRYCSIALWLIPMLENPPSLKIFCIVIFFVRSEKSVIHTSAQSEASALPRGDILSEKSTSAVKS